MNPFHSPAFPVRYSSHLHFISPPACCLLHFTLLISSVFVYFLSRLSSSLLFPLHSSSTPSAFSVFHLGSPLLFPRAKSFTSHFFSFFCSLLFTPSALLYFPSISFPYFFPPLAVFSPISSFILVVLSPSPHPHPFCPSSLPQSAISPLLPFLQLPFPITANNELCFRICRFLILFSMSSLLLSLPLDHSPTLHLLFHPTSDPYSTSHFFSL